jgi:hypothetical protein
MSPRSLPPLWQAFVLTARDILDQRNARFTAKLYVRQADRDSGGRVGVRSWSRTWDCRRWPCWKRRLERVEGAFRDAKPTRICRIRWRKSIRTQFSQRGPQLLFHLTGQAVFAALLPFDALERGEKTLGVRFAI